MLFTVIITDSDCQLCVCVCACAFKTAQELCLYDTVLIMLELLLYTYIEN